jgi:hypothetical protein
VSVAVAVVCLLTAAAAIFKGAGVGSLIAVMVVSSVVQMACVTVNLVLMYDFLKLGAKSLGARAGRSALLTSVLGILACVVVPITAFTMLA